MTQFVPTFRKSTDKEANTMASNDVEVLDPAATVEKLTNNGSEFALNRRHFMAALGVAGAAAGAALVSSHPAIAQQPKPSGYLEVDVLNFLLNVKYLKATFYSYVTQGVDLPGTSRVTLGTGGVFNAPTKVVFTGTNAAQITDMFNEIYFDDLNQLIDLRNLIGVPVVPRQTMNLLGTGTSTTVSAPITPAQAISTARMLEDLSASAFTGALVYLSGTNRAYAAQVLAAEGFHAGAVRLVSIQNAAPYQAAEYLLPFTGTTTSGSPTIPALFTTTAGAPLPAVGNIVAGTGIPTNAVITAIVGANTPIVGTTNKTTSITAVSSTAGLLVGQLISGAGIPANATITVISGSTITISAAATATTANQALFVGTAVITISANATASGKVTISVINADADVQPFDPGTAALAAAGPSTLSKSSPAVDQGFFDTAGAGTSSANTPPGFAFARTFSQVLAVLYGSAVIQTFQGGYYPVGVSGNINVV